MYNAENAIEASQALQYLRDKIVEEKIYDLKVGTDWEEIELLASETEKKYIGEHFRRAINTTPPEDGFWIAGLDKDGSLVAMVAARLQRTGGWSLRRYWNEYFPRAYKSSSGGPVELARNQTGFADRIGGDVAYIGEGWVGHDWAGHALSVLFVQMASVLACQLWRPSYLYGWMRPRHALRGTAIKWGFTECYPEAIRFDAPPVEGDLEALYFVGLPAEGAKEMIARLAALYRGRESSK
ncbi:hypothetical protein [Breoghania sp. JC706]|uniref:hypothetical protein n=1 Tax=Breoghania sp. JC706 TaxID=3117732 RepID=UPI003009C73E